MFFLILSIFVFVSILSLLVFVHELGHYVAAKKAGVRVEEFGLGIPPRVIGKKIGETVYSLNLLPFGGFVKLTGEELDERMDLSKALKDKENFLSKKPWVRAVILTAGVFMNILFAFIFYYLMLNLNGFKSPVLPLFVDYDFRFGNERKINTVITSVAPGSPAESVGVTFGDTILEINDQPVYSVADVKGKITQNKDLNTKILLMDIKSTEQNVRTVFVTPQEDEEGRVLIGVSLGSAVTISYETQTQRLFAGPMHAYNMAAYTYRILSELISSSVETRDLSPVSSSVSGPVGIFSAVGAIVKSSGRDVLINLIDLTALLSLSLGIMNLLPIPALDGGRLVFVIIESVIGKRINPVKEAAVHRFGMALLLALMVLITFKDVRNLIG